MITANFKKFLALILQSVSSAAPGYLAAIDTEGNTVYLSQRMYFPGTISTTVNISSSISNSGIYLGSSSTPASENDHFLKQNITTGLRASNPTIETGADNNDDSYVKFLFTVTNTTNNDIIINEIGYTQKLYASNTKGGSANNSPAILFDRTVFDTPLTVPAGESAVIRYTLKTIM